MISGRGEIGLRLSSSVWLSDVLNMSYEFLRIRAMALYWTATCEGNTASSRIPPALSSESVRRHLQTDMRQRSGTLAPLATEVS